MAVSNPGLTSLRGGYRAVVVGASGGIGDAFVRMLLADPRCGRVHALSRAGHIPCCDDERLAPGQLDLLDEASIVRAFDVIDQDMMDDDGLDLIIVATGVLHGDGFGPEKSWRHLDAVAMAEVFALNAIGPAIIGKHALPRMPRDRRAIFAALSARVGSIGDNRLGGWHAYRASKAALNMIVRNFSIELRRRNLKALAVSLHPGTVDTALSAPFQKGLDANKTVTPDQSAANLLQVMDALSPDDSGMIFDWQGKRIPE